MDCLNIGRLLANFILPLSNSGIIFVNESLFYVLDLRSHPLMNCIILDFFLTLSFIPWLISEKIFNSKENKPKRKNSPFDINNLNTSIIILFLVISEIFLNIFKSAVINGLETKINNWSFEIIFTIIFSKLILKTMFFRHQQISLIICFLAGIALLLIDILHLEQENKLIWIIYFIQQILTSLSTVLIRTLTEIKDFSIFKVLFIIGASGFIIHFLLLELSTYVSCNGFFFDLIQCSVKNDEKTFFDNLFSFFDDIKKRYAGNDPNYKYGEKYKGNLYVFLSLGYQIFSYISLIIYTYIIKIASPFHTYITSCFLGLLFRIHDLFEYTKMNNFNSDSFLIKVYYIYIFILLVIFFWGLVFSEIIELKCCGLNLNTQRNIDNRNELYENRKEAWLANKGVGDADCTLVDGQIGSEEYQSEGSNEDEAISMATLTAVQSQIN